MYLLKLHGIKHQLTTRHTSVIVEDSIDEDGAELGGRKSSDQMHLVRKGSAKEATAGGGGETVFRRRHSLAAAQKNTDWADLYLSTTATADAMAGFLSYKPSASAAAASSASSSGGADATAEYFINYIPKAVQAQDLVYKELLAVYNALRFWSGGKDSPLRGKNLLLAVFNPDAEKLLKAANVKGTVGPEKLLLVKEINDACTRHDVRVRVAETMPGADDAAVHALVRSQTSPRARRRFADLLAGQDGRNRTDRPLVAKEKIFPPTYIT